MTLSWNRLPCVLAAALCLATPIAGVAQASALKSQPATITEADPHFEALVGKRPHITTIYDQGIWSEGAQAMPDGSVIWSDVKANKVMRWEEGKGVEVWLKPSQFQNGHALDNEGRLLAASHGKRAIERLEADGKWHVLVDLYGDHKLNSPNDLIVDRQGDIWFTDPAFGINNPKESYGGNAVQDGDYSYRYTPSTHALTRLDTPLVKAPNGIALSPDERTLYISDSQQAYDFDSKALNHYIVAYDVAADKSLSNGRVITEISPGIPDGIKVDAEGNIWSSSKGSLQVFTSEGKLLGKIAFPGVVGNMVFAMDAKTKKPVLYVAASNALYRLDINVKGALMP